MNDAVRVLSLVCLFSVAGAWADNGFQYGEQYDKPLNQRGNEAAGGVAGSVEDRLLRIERSLSSGALMEMVGRVDQLQTEMQMLRGQVEELSHSITTLREQQSKQYQDLDQRLQQVGTASAANSGSGEAGSGATPNSEPSVPVAASTDSSDTGGDRPTAYEKAFATLKDGKYPEAIAQFKAFLSRFPSGELADNAQYWLGEAYYVSRDFNGAGDSFKKVVEQFPDSAKVPDAHLKLGFVDYEQGQWAKARETLGAVLLRYPGSSAAKLAEKRLERMRQEGH